MSDRSEYLERILMAVTFAEAGENETAIQLLEGMDAQGHAEEWAAGALTRRKAVVNPT